MKTIKINKITVVLFFFLIGSGIQTTQAQFWKKLKKRVKDGVEEAVLRKTEEKSTEKTEKVMDTLFAAPKKIGKNRKGKHNKKNQKANKNGLKQGSSLQNNDNISSSAIYNFEWKYVLKMESDEMKKQTKGEADFKTIYYLNPNSTAFATKFEMEEKAASAMGNMIMINDPNTGVNLMLTEMNGHKMKQTMRSVFKQGLDNQDQESVNYTIVKTDTKTILGYTCQGFKINTTEGIINMYIAKDAPVSFNQSLSGNSRFKPKGFDTKWTKEFKNGLMMEMQFKSNKKKKYNMKLTCVELVEEPFSINIGEYKSLMDMTDN